MIINTSVCTTCSCQEVSPDTSLPSQSSPSPSFSAILPAASAGILVEYRRASGKWVSCKSSASVPHPTAHYHAEDVTLEGQQHTKLMCLDLRVSLPLSIAGIRPVPHAYFGTSVNRFTSYAVWNAAEGVVRVCWLPASPSPSHRAGAVQLYLSDGSTQIVLMQLRAGRGDWLPPPVEVPWTWLSDAPQETGSADGSIHATSTVHTRALCQALACVGVRLFPFSPAPVMAG